MKTTMRIEKIIYKNKKILTIIHIYVNIVMKTEYFVSPYQERWRE